MSNEQDDLEAMGEFVHIPDDAWKTVTFNRSPWEVRWCLQGDGHVGVTLWLRLNLVQCPEVGEKVFSVGPLPSSTKRHHFVGFAADGDSVLIELDGEPFARIGVPA